MTNSRAILPSELPSSALSLRAVVPSSPLPFVSHEPTKTWSGRLSCLLSCARHDDVISIVTAWHTHHGDDSGQNVIFVLPVLYVQQDHRSIPSIIDGRGLFLPLGLLLCNAKIPEEMEIATASWSSSLFHADRGHQCTRNAAVSEPAPEPLQGAVRITGKPPVRHHDNDNPDHTNQERLTPPWAPVHGIRIHDRRRSKCRSRSARCSSRSPSGLHRQSVTLVE